MMDDEELGMEKEELDLLPGIRRSPMAPYIGTENQITRYESNGTPETRTFTERQRKAKEEALRPK